MAVSFRYALRTDLGTVRTNNEDSALASPRLLVLADGMGGHAAGEVASAVSLRVFSEVDASQSPTGEEFLRAGRLARRALFAMSEADPMLESMGTTLVAVGSDGEAIKVGHIGDSRVYALREGSLYQVTTDHTHVQRLIETGELTPERARTHPYRSMLLKSLDDQPAGPDLDIIEAQVRPGDRVLLCSDGLSDYVDPDEIGAALATADREAAAAALIEVALQVGTRDNVTVVVADVVFDSDSDTDAPADPDDHPLAAPPQVVGAADDGVSLSGAAAAALRDSLPDMPFDATAPMAGMRLATPQPPVRSQTTVAPPSTAENTDQTPAARSEPAQAGSEEQSTLPGIVAAAGVLVLAVLLYLVLG